VESEDVVVTDLFAHERASLIELLSSLAAGQWQAPTVCPGWSVKDVALHLLGDDIDLLSRRRDGAAPADAPSRPAGFQELVVSLDRLNQTWVEATRRISTRLRPGQRSRSRAILRLAFRSWTPLPSSARRKTEQDASQAA
jgi:uncharacterized protein (TIGR03083 family)